MNITFKAFIVKQNYVVGRKKYVYASQYKWGWVSRQTVELGLRGGERQTCHLEKSGYVS